MPLKRASSTAAKYQKPEDPEEVGRVDDDEEPDAIDEDDEILEDEDPDEVAETPTSLQNLAGWDAAQKVLDQTSSGNDLKITGTEQLIKFLDAAPISSFAQHWVDVDGERRAFLCLGIKCPLCDIGAKARPRFAFAVALIADEVVGPLVLWAGQKMFDDLKAENTARSGPLTKHFYTVHKTGEQLKTKYYIKLVRGRDLPDEWDLDLAEVEAECAKVKPLLGADVTPKANTRKELLEVARTL